MAKKTDVSPLGARVREASRFIASRIKQRPEAGIVLGTGLGALAERIENAVRIDYREIPHFPVSTVKGHAGVLTSGTVGKRKVVAMEGRFHYYEGYSLEEVTFGVRVMKALGCSALVVSNASGGMNPLFSHGDIVLITDHINLMGVNPLIGPNDDALGTRFPDMSEPYDREFMALAGRIALRERVPLKKGVYVGVTGPNLETKAEYRFLRMAGADMVGMSTVPEVIVAAHCGLRVLGLSCITDLCLPDALKPADINEIIRVANEAEPVLTGLVVDFLKEVKL